MTERFDRVYGGLLGLALGDTISYPAALHRGLRLRPWQRTFQRRTDLEMLDHRVLRLTLPFGFGYGDDTLLPGPTDDTEMAALTARTLIAHGGDPTAEDFADAWRALAAQADELWTGFSEKAALVNLGRGMAPPATGGDNPQGYDDGAAARAVPVGLVWAGRPERAAELAAADACVTHADEGVWAARAMAAAIAALAGGADLDAALAEGRRQFPPESWLEWVDRRVVELARHHDSAADLTLALGRDVVTRTYSYANAAAETLPAAFAIVQATDGDLWQGVLLANICARAADSLPAMVGALAGTLRGAGAISGDWEATLRTLRGICIPDLAGVDLHALAADLAGIER
ncbi:MAG: ADP-ribosylglycohydrolase family protein [Chloroflexota bacterium]